MTKSFITLALLATPLLAQVTLSTAVPAIAEPGVTLVTLTGGNFPAGSILPSQVTVRLEPNSPATGPVVVTAATGIQTVVGATRRVTFTVPGTLVLPTATSYRVSIAGSTSTGTSFATATPVLLTIQPVAGILSSNPAAIQTGQAAAMVIRTQLGNFQQGSTDATLGEGVSVGVMPVGNEAPVTDAFGNPGRVIVVDANTMLALVRVAPDAAIGSRELAVRQGPATYRRSDALSIQAAQTATSATSVLTLPGVTVPSTGIPGTTTFTLSTTGLPAGSLAPDQVKIYLESRFNSATTPSITVTPSAISAESNNSRTITFQLPPTLVLAQPTEYLATVYGSTSGYGVLGTGVTFLSANRASVTLGPPAGPATPVLSSLSPFAGQQGQSLTIALTGLNTNFAQGQSVAMFGPGIAVGGAAAGQFGPVSVASPTLATASILIQPGAVLGPRIVELRTGPQSVLLRDGFSVLQGPTILTLSSVQPTIARPGSVVLVNAAGFPPGNILTSAVVLTLAPARAGIGPATSVGASAITPDSGGGARQITFAVPPDLVFPQPEAFLLSVAGTSAAGIPFSTGSPVPLTIQPLPRLISISPDTGQRGQSVPVVMTGSFTDFAGAANTLTLGPGITASSIVAGSATRLTATLSIAANAALGPRTVTVATGSSEIATLPNGFTVSEAAPVSLTLSNTTTPASARAGDAVSVLASNFPAGDVAPAQLTVTLEPANGGGAAAVQLTPTSVIDTANNARQIRFTIPNTVAVTSATNYLVSVAGATAAGTSFTSSNRASLSILPPAASPSISSISPNQGSQGQTLTVNVTGQNTTFSGASTQISFGAGIIVSALTVSSATSLTAQITIGSLAAPGPRSVVVTTGAQSVSLGGGFNVTAALPSLSSLTPAQGAQGQTLTLSIKGENTSFAPATTQVAISGTGVTAANITVLNALNLTAQVTIAPTAPAGPRTVTVTTGSEILTGAFSVTATAPLISSVSPASAPPGQSVALTVTGQNTNFGPSSTVAFSGSGITVSSVTVASATALTAQLAIAADAAPGTRTLTVTTGAETVTSNAFQISSGGGSGIVISSVTPGVGATGSTVQVTIVGVGTSFSQASSVVSFGAGVSPGPLTVASANQISTLLTIAPEAAPGPRTVTVTTGTQVASLVDGFAVVGPEVTLLSPADKSFVNTPSITVSGRVNDSTAIVEVNGVRAPNNGGSFTVAIPLSEGNNTVTAVVTTAAGATSSNSVLVNLDTTPPRVAVLSPLDQDETTEERINVAGNVNDIVVGTVNEVQAQVTVNGVAAEVSNRSFVARNIALQPGVNTMQIVARDRVGNAFTNSIKVTRVMAPLLKLTVVSGNNQSATINTQLPQPVVVQLTDGLGIPKPNTPVFFRVAANDGSVGGALAKEVRTDEQGMASTAWIIGSRSGAGINRLEVGATGVTAPGVFTASGTPAAPARIIVDSGLNQTGAVGQKLALPFVGVVIDSGNNRLAGVPVTVTVRSGGGKIAGEESATLTSDPDGRVAQTLTLGPQEGVENNEVHMTLQARPASTAVFSASGRLPKRIENTKVSGVVLDNSNQPVAGVTVRILRLNQGSASNLATPVAPSSLSTVSGNFEIRGVPAGVFKLVADGTTVPGPKKYPTLEFDITTVSGQDNTIGMPLFLPAIDIQNQLCVDEHNGGTLRPTRVPGFSMTVVAGAATFPGGVKRGCISVTPVNIDKVPMVPGFGQQPRFVVTIQPAGTRFNPPASISMPNVDGLPPHTITEMYSYDHDLAAFVSIGGAQVSGDGLLVTSLPATGVVKAGWHCGGNPAIVGPLAPVLGNFVDDPIVIDLQTAPLRLRGYDSRGHPVYDIVGTTAVSKSPPQFTEVLNWRASGAPSIVGFTDNPTCVGASVCGNNILINPRLGSGSACGVGTAQATVRCIEPPNRTRPVTAAIEVKCGSKSASECQAECSTGANAGICGTPCSFNGQTGTNSGAGCWKTVIGGVAYCAVDRFSPSESEGFDRPRCCNGVCNTDEGNTVWGGGSRQNYVCTISEPCNLRADGGAACTMVTTP